MGRFVELEIDFDCCCYHMMIYLQKYLLNWMVGFPKEFMDSFMAGCAVSR